ncbi:hypothetical protein BC828DRAFT_383555 [Blastocladiella britannica]|nr:hypothetical protein BC828DRAFT_383555 [Blastocladiella britannica]
MEITYAPARLLHLAVLDGLSDQVLAFHPPPPRSSVQHILQTTGVALAIHSLTATFADDTELPTTAVADPFTVTTHRTRRSITVHVRGGVSSVNGRYALQLSISSPTTVRRSTHGGARTHPPVLEVHDLSEHAVAGLARSALARFMLAVDPAAAAPPLPQSPGEPRHRRDDDDVESVELIPEAQRVMQAELVPAVVRVLADGKVDEFEAWDAWPARCPVIGAPLLMQPLPERCMLMRAEDGFGVYVAGDAWSVPEHRLRATWVSRWAALQPALDDNDTNNDAASPPVPSPPAADPPVADEANIAPPTSMASGLASWLQSTLSRSSSPSGGLSSLLRRTAPPVPEPTTTLPPPPPPVPLTSAVTRVSGTIVCIPDDPSSLSSFPRPFYLSWTRRGVLAMATLIPVGVSGATGTDRAVVLEHESVARSWLAACSPDAVHPATPRPLAPGEHITPAATSVRWGPAGTVVAGIDTPNNGDNDNCLHWPHSGLVAGVPDLPPGAVARAAAAVETHGQVAGARIAVGYAQAGPRKVWVGADRTRGKGIAVVPGAVHSAGRKPAAVAASDTASVAEKVRDNVSLAAVVEAMALVSVSTVAE